MKMKDSEFKEAREYPTRSGKVGRQFSELLSNAVNSGGRVLVNITVRPEGTEFDLESAHVREMDHVLVIYQDPNGVAGDVTLKAIKCRNGEFEG